MITWMVHASRFSATPCSTASRWRCPAKCTRSAPQTQCCTLVRMTENTQVAGAGLSRSKEYLQSAHQLSLQNAK